MFRKLDPDICCPAARHMSGSSDRSAPSDSPAAAAGERKRNHSEPSQPSMMRRPAAQNRLSLPRERAGGGLMKTGVNNPDARHNRHGVFVARYWLPLPAGEGWGEGPRTENASSFAYVNLTEYCAMAVPRVTRPTSANRPLAPARRVGCRVKLPRSISGFRTFRFSRSMAHSPYYEESRVIKFGQRPEITKARNDESPQKCHYLRLPRLSALGNRGVLIHPANLRNSAPHPSPLPGEREPVISGRACP